MMNFLKKHVVVIVCALVSHALIFAAGYYVSIQRSKADLGERALGSFMQGLSALAYLEKGNIDGARHSLRTMLDSDLLVVSEYGTPGFDAYSAAKNPAAKQKLMVQYDDIRKKYPPINYSDGGRMNRNVDDVLNGARRSLGKQN